MFRDECSQVRKGSISMLIDLGCLGPSPAAYIHLCKDPRHCTRPLVPMLSHPGEYSHVS